MTTTADLVRKWIAKAPDKATQLELHPIGGIPGSSPIASWPADEVKGDVEAARLSIMEAAQEHCDVEAETCTLQMMWTRGSTGLAARRIRIQPSPEAAATAERQSGDPIVRELLRAMVEQNKMMLHATSTIVTACQSTLSAATEQVRTLQERLSNEPRTEIVDDHERALKRQAINMLVQEGPTLIQAIAGSIAAHAESKLVHGAALNGSGQGAPPTQ